MDGRGHTYIEFDACHDCLTKIVETVKGTFKNTHADNVDDLISRSALLKEIGDPGDGMVWPTKEGVIARKLKLRLLLKKITRNAPHIGLDVDGDVVTVQGKSYYVDILHNYIQEV